MFVDVLLKFYFRFEIKKNDQVNQLIYLKVGIYLKHIVFNFNILYKNALLCTQFYKYFFLLLFDLFLLNIITN